MTGGEFRCAFFASDYETTVAFYRDGLDLPILESWDHGPDDMGTLFAAASGIIEILAVPQHKDTSTWNYDEPRGVMIVVEADDVDRWYRRALDQGLPVREELKDQTWGHRSFRVTDPNGVTLYIFSRTSGDGADRR